MTDPVRRPSYQDYQHPSLYRTGLSLRRSYLTGEADSVEEGMMLALLKRFDERHSAPTTFAPGKLSDRETEFLPVKPSERETEFLPGRMPG